MLMLKCSDEVVRIRYCGDKTVSRIDDILSDLIGQGYTPDDIKKAVITSMKDLFENENNLAQFAMTGDILHMWEFIIRYHHHSNFMLSVKLILNHYRQAYNKSPLNVKKIYKDMFNNFVNRENIMWSMRRDKLDLENINLHDFTVSCMRRIGSLLEVNLKNYLVEFYALLKIIKGKPIELDKIKEFDFGVIVNNILDIPGFEDILKISPLNIKVSDWRNVAYHHSYVINGDEIMCEYGKYEKKKKFIIDRKQLIYSVHEIVKNTNVFYIVHWIFFFDHFDEIVEACKSDKLETIHIQDEILEESLKISLLSQGYKLVELQKSELLTSIKLYDELNSGALDKRSELKRKIHASQFLCNIWSHFPSKILRVEYCNKMGEIKAIFEVSGEVCELIGKGEKDLSYLAGKVEFIRV